MSSELPYIILGDFNIIPTEKDVYDYTNWLDDALFRIESKKKYRQLINLGLYAFLLERKSMLTHWDYQGYGTKTLGKRSYSHMFKNMRTHYERNRQAIRSCSCVSRKLA